MTDNGWCAVRGGAGPARDARGAFVFNQFTDYVANASGWAYAAVFLLALLDAILPVVPSEPAVITAGGVVAGGRTVVALGAGLLHVPWRRFIAFDAVAALVWALYAAVLGYFGGRAFENAAWKGLLLALGVGFAIAGLVEAVRWVLGRRRRP